MAKVRVDVMFEDDNGEQMKLTGLTPRWDGKMTALAENIKLAAEKALGPFLTEHDKLLKEIASLKAQLPAEPEPAKKKSPDNVVTSASGKGRGRRK